MTTPPPHGERYRRGQPSGGAILRPEIAIPRKLREEMISPKAPLWQELRGSTVRRRHLASPYAVDFSSNVSRPIGAGTGEMRGNLPACEALRDTFLQDNGYRVRRIAAANILRNLDAVTTAIVTHAARPLHHSASSKDPAPCTGEE